MNQKVACKCGHEFLWSAASLRNPIQPPTKPESSGGGFKGFGISLVIFGIFLLFAGGRKSPEVGFWIAAIGVGLVGLGALARALAQNRYARWFQGPEGLRYAEHEKDLTMAREAFQRVEEAARRSALEKQRQELAHKARDRDYLLNLSPRDFEQHVSNLFAALGYKVTLTPASMDEGVDAYLEKDGRRAIVQCKHLTRGAVSRPSLQQFFGVLKDKRVNEGFFVTTGRFTEHAIEFAKNKAIHLVDLDKLIHMAGGAFTEEFIRSGPLGQVTHRSRRRYRWYQR